MLYPTLTALLVLLFCYNQYNSYPRTLIPGQLHLLTHNSHQWVSYHRDDLVMCAITYTRDQLLNINNNNSKPSNDVLSAIDGLSLVPNRVQFSKTRRLHRGGKDSRCKIPPLIGYRPVDYFLHQDGSNANHLVSLQKVPLSNATFTSKEFKVAAVNVCSVRNKLDRIIGLVIQHDLDILALTEIWLTSDEKDQFYINALTLPGYNLYCYPRKDDSGYGGVAVLARATIPVKSM